MPSFQIVPVPQGRITLEGVEETIQKLSIHEDSSEFKRGILPGTLGRSEKGPIWFKYGVQDEMEYNTLDGTGTTKYLEEYVVAFLGNGFIAISNTDNETKDDILSLIKHQFLQDISPETTEFSEEALRKIINDANETLLAYLAPRERSKPERVSGKDRDLPGTDFWDDYGDEPLDKIKVNVDGEETEIRVGFDKYGVVVLYKQSLNLSEQIEALRILAENLFTRLIDPGSYQSTFSDEEEDI
ncbi:hypothetical protein C457_11181 [Haloferax prahovense DSM 18310]|uniref:Uncharacterized protein n=1 Tax=Haloferax prahovense (strain DSM 18310 / JCM 13924 / TL6) TaxID=1227461 RepID=M0GAK5_HALPT|nr:hypothetical protein [Haloferax prahovense]ELZ68563.1 hypothetical protein C457_11181 [Haloferax prahovense DSM 18310]